MVNIPKVSDRKANKPVYILAADDPTTKTGLQYYKVEDLNENSAASIEFKGAIITKTNAEKLSKDVSADINNAPNVNMKLPWHRVISISNINYRLAKNPQGEKQ